MTDGKKIFGAFVVAIALFFVWPAVIGAYQVNSALSASVAEREQLLETRQKTLATVQAAWQQYQSSLNVDDGLKFAGLVPAHKDTAEIVSAIQDIASTAGITVGSIALNAAPAAANQQFATMTMNLDMTGSYSSLQTFLTGLESYVRLLNVNSISIKLDSRAAGTLHFSIQAVAYFLK